MGTETPTTPDVAHAVSTALVVEAQFRRPTGFLRDGVPAETVYELSRHVVARTEWRVERCARPGREWLPYAPPDWSTDPLDWAPPVAEMNERAERAGASVRYRLRSRTVVEMATEWAGEETAAH